MITALLFIGCVLTYFIVATLIYRVDRKYDTLQTIWEEYVDDTDSAIYATLWALTIPITLIIKLFVVINKIVTYFFNKVSTYIDILINKYKERSLTPLNEVSGRVISNIKERTQPW